MELEKILDIHYISSANHRVTTAEADRNNQHYIPFQQEGKTLLHVVTLGLRLTLNTDDIADELKVQRWKYVTNVQENYRANNQTRDESLYAANRGGSSPRQVK